MMTVAAGYVETARQIIVVTARTVKVLLYATTAMIPSGKRRSLLVVHHFAFIAARHRLAENVIGCRR